MGDHKYRGAAFGSLVLGQWANMLVPVRAGDVTAGTRDFRVVGPRDWLDVNRDIMPPGTAAQPQPPAGASPDSPRQEEAPR